MRRSLGGLAQTVALYRPLDGLLLPISALAETAR